MEEDYDVFGPLNNFRKNNVLQEYKKTVPEAEVDADLSLEDLLNTISSTSSGRKGKAGKKKESTTLSLSPCESPMLEATLSSRKPPVPTAKKTKRKTATKKQGENIATQPTEPPTLAPPTPAPLTPPAPPSEEVVTNRPLTRRSLRTARAQQEASGAALNTTTTVEKTTRGRGRKKNQQPETPAAVVAPALTMDTSALLSSSPGDMLMQWLENPPRGRRQGTNSQRDVMRARRNYIAEIAARSTNVDYVDLVTAPIPRIEGVINVDSDNEEAASAEKVGQSAAVVHESNSLELSYSEDNPELSVKVNWKGHPEVFLLRKYQKFAHIFKILAERENTGVENMVFNLDNRVIMSNDTPASIDYKVFQFINGRVWENQASGPQNALKKKRDVNSIRLKIQSDQWKRPLQLEILKTEKFKILYIKCAEELNMPYELMKMSFDGELLEFDATPQDLELEGGEAIDLRFKK